MAYCAEYQRPISVIDQVLHRKDNCWFTEEQKAEFEKQFKRIKKRLEDPRLYIAMIGDFNAGKSTFLNRMVKLDILKVEHRAATSIPTLLSVNAQLQEPKMLLTPNHTRETVILSSSEFNFKICTLL